MSPVMARNGTLTSWTKRCGIAKPLFGTTATHAACLFATWGDEKAKDFFRAIKGNATRNAAATILVSIKHTRLDGVILTPPLSDNQVVRESLIEQKIPHVLISPPKLLTASNSKPTP